MVSAYAEKLLLEACLELLTTDEMSRADQAAIAGKPLDLTYMEYELLKFLITHPGRVFSRESLLTAVWGPAYDTQTNYLRVHMASIRRKLDRSFIETIRSLGYRVPI